MEALLITPSQSLRSLYFTRTAVQLAWAVTVIISAASNPTLAATLLVLYPLWDVACTVYDIKTSDPATSTVMQYINAAFGLLTAVGIALTAYTQPQHAVAIFGLWAAVAGALQPIVGILRRKRLGGQWAMILSGLQSLAAGVAFLLGSATGKFHIKDLGGYAIFGGVYFLLAGIFLGRKR